MGESRVSIDRSTRTMDSRLAGRGGILTQERSLSAGSVQGHWSTRAWP